MNLNNLRKANDTYLIFSKNVIHQRTVVRFTVVDSFHVVKIGIYDVSSTVHCNNCEDI